MKKCFVRRTNVWVSQDHMCVFGKDVGQCGQVLIMHVCTHVAIHHGRYPHFVSSVIFPTIVSDVTVVLWARLWKGKAPRVQGRVSMAYNARTHEITTVALDLVTPPFKNPKRSASRCNTRRCDIKKTNEGAVLTCKNQLKRRSRQLQVLAKVCQPRTSSAVLINGENSNRFPLNPINFAPHFLGEHAHAYTPAGPPSRPHRLIF